MKQGYIHVAFVIDESGSMAGSASDVIGGFNDMVQEQRDLKEGTCSISLYKFSDDVNEVYVGKDVSEVSDLKKGTKSRFHWGRLFGSLDDSSDSSESEADTYSPGGCTAMNDGIGTAIDNIGKWLSDMPEDERPEKNLIVIMTDGQENASSKYTLAKVKDMIKHQTDKYSWSFMYMGTDITTTKDADDLGINIKSYSARKDISDSYKMISSSAAAWRTYDNSMDVRSKAMCFNTMLCDTTSDMTRKYESETGVKLTPDDENAKA